EFNGFPDRHYICLKDMKVERANAMPSPYIAGLPSMYGIVGLTKYLVDDVLRDFNVQFDAAAICIRDFAMSDSQQKYSCYSPEDIRKHQMIRIITARNSWLYASLLVRVNTSMSLSQLQTWLDENRFLDGFYRLRFCGGHIFFKAGIPQLYTLEENEVSDFCNQLDGFTIADRIELCRAGRQEGEDALDTMFRLIEESREWLVPLAVGYKSFGSRKLRKGCRKKIPHSFCDSVTGLGGLFNIRSVSELIGKSDSFFWRPSNLDFIVNGSI
ncbi:type I-F CRISPR-associated protein Csy2, partial [Sansalvadorimonas verongulae]|uniref:type I-F CRISPR-associated protein Csy2 n=1 Tax=Sansalvadorimonas verongulae TaxID=2172824 RepID=UPI0012BBC317